MLHAQSFAFVEHAGAFVHVDATTVLGAAWPAMIIAIFAARVWASAFCVGTGRAVVLHSRVFGPGIGSAWAFGGASVVFRGSQARGSTRNGRCRLERDWLCDGGAFVVDADSVNGFFACERILDALEGEGVVVLTEFVS